MAFVQGLVADVNMFVERSQQLFTGYKGVRTLSRRFLVVTCLKRGHNKANQRREEIEVEILFF